MRYRDKDYVLTHDKLLFNVTGYEHPEDSIYASLKYVSGKKWVGGYRSAKQFLARHYPRYVGDYVRVPRASVVRSWLPQRCWESLKTANTLGELHRKALDLGTLISEQLEIPPDRFGITDSLLWGSGQAGSDIDLVVYGKRAAWQVLERGRMLYEDTRITRADPKQVKSPYGLEVPNWHLLLKRKHHMGCFRGTPFSLRAVREWHEILPFVERRPVGAEDIEFTVVDATESLFFPAIYRDATGNELVDYTVVFEGALTRYDQLQGLFQVEECQGNGLRRYVVWERQLGHYVRQLLGCA